MMFGTHRSPHRRSTHIRWFRGPEYERRTRL